MIKNAKLLKIHLFLILHFVFGLFLTACDSSNDSAFSSLEAGGNGSTAKCEITSFFPSEKSFRVAAKSGNLTNFSVTPNVSSCEVTYKINNQPVSIEVKGGLVNIDSDLLTEGDNIVEAVAANQISSTSMVWTVKKNIPPNCLSQTPTSSGNSLAIPGSLNLTATSSDANNDAITFNWKLNNRVSPNNFTGLISGSSASTISFIPTTDIIGNNTVVADMYDGLDHSYCEWSINVTGDCGIASSAPSASVVRVASNSSTNSTFSVTTNTPGCTAQWSLNGVTLPDTTTTSQISSSSLNVGNNILTASLGSGSSAVTRTWMVVKNTPPTCANQTPPNSTTILTGVGIAKTFVASGDDANGDSLSFAWTINGLAAGSLIATSSTSTTGTGIFSAASSNVGTNTISAIMNDGYDSNSCTWTTTTVDTCVVASFIPSSSSSRISSSGLPLSFSLVSNDSNCNVSWKINGIDLGTGNFVDLFPSNTALLSAPSTNTVSATLNNGIHTPTVKSWTVIKNTPPVCLSPTPTSYTGNTLAIPSSMNFGMIAGDSNSDPLTFTWKVNGVSNAPSLSTPTSGGNASLTSFSPSGPNIGNNIISLDINDGYDTTQCSWNINVSGDCAVTGESPSTAGQTRVAAAGSTLNTFSLTTTTLGCTASWTLNGLPISGTSLTQQIQSSQLLAGANSLTATVANGINSTIKTWTILKNNLPTCSASPSNAGSVIAGVGVGKPFVATATDADGDSITFSWLYNNANPGGIISSSATGNVGTGVYVGTTGTLGTGTITAVMNDGYDTNRCDWDIQTVNACAVTSSLPSVATLKMAAFGGVQTFGIVPNSSSCNISWDLNGTPIGSGNFFDLTSANSSLVQGTNTLVATLSNGIHTSSTQSWTVTKNTPPTCASTTPATTVSLNYGSSQSLTANINNGDDDSLTYSWSFDGSSPGLFSSLSNSTGTGTASALATLTPVFANIGVGHTASVSFTDGYDSNQCSWNVDVQDPNHVQISSCLPAENPAVVYSQGSNSNRLFTVSATGPSLTYQWKLNDVNIGTNSSTNTFSAGSLPVGNYTAKVVVTDQYGNQEECNWNIKRNSPPSIDTYTPSASKSIRVNINNTLGFTATATDANSDTITYNWTLNSGSNSSILPTGLPSSVLNFNGNDSYLGVNNITLTVTDGYESTSQSWSVEANVFSQDCNNIFNGPATGSGATGGNICTLVGDPGVGSGLNPTQNQGLVKIQPTHLIDDGAGNIIFSDIQSHTVLYYNRSGSDLSRFGKVIPAGKLIAILGNGLNGLNNDFSYNTDFKLSTPLGLAYDSTNQKLFIADNANHRVVMLDNTGQATTVFGTTGTTQNLTTNADSALGTSLVCHGPQDLLIIGEWLYISCYNMSAIKKMNINPLSPNYLFGFTEVGYRNATGTIVAGNSDGSTGINGIARTNGPIALAQDGDGNLYWSDYNTSRIRMLNLSASNKSFFPLRSISANFNISAGDLSSTPLTAPSNIVINAATSSTTPDTLYVWGPAKVVTNTCIPFRVQSRVGAVPSLAQSNITVSLSSGGVGTIYSDSGCTTSTGSITIATGTSENEFYYKRGSGTGSLTLTASGLTTNGTYNVSVSAAGGTATKLVLAGPNSFEYSTCTKLMLQVQDASNLPTTSSTNRTLWLANDNTGNFYADSSCSATPINSINLVAATTRDAYIYYAKTTIAPAGQVVSLFGNNNSQLYAAGGQASMTLRQPRGLLVDYSGSTINGFFVTSNNTTGVDTHHRIIYVNNQTVNKTYGGTVLSAYNQGGASGANHGAAAIAGITTSGYNGDDSLGSLTKLFYPWGLSFNNSKSQILFADNQNARLRSLDISIDNGNVTTLVGQGRLRSGFIGDTLMKAPDVYLNGPSKAVIDNSTRKMYIGDSGNGRIRELNLLTGMLETIVGRGIGDANVDPEDPLFVYSRSIRGMALINSGSNKYLLYTDNQGNTGVNTSCLVRAINLSSTTGTLFGVSIASNKVANIAGDFSLGCNTFNGVGAGTSRTLNQPEDIAYDGSNLYVLSYNDHCVLKLASDGTMSPFAGTCGVAGNVDGQTPNTGSLALIRFPMGITLDLDNIGNLFIADQIDQNTGRVKYINTSSSAINVGGSTVSGVTTGNVSRIQTLWTLIPQGGIASRINSLATFGNIVCWSAGLSGNGHNGPHAVYCADKTTGTISRKAGPSEQSSNYIRGGAPLGREQENIAGVSATLAAPYGLTFDADGNLYIVERSSHTIRMLRRWY